MSEKTQLNLENFPVCNSRKHALPIPGIKSRLCSSIILSYQGRAKEVIQLAILVSNDSRAFIITQDCLRGFLINKHTNNDSLLFDLQTSARFRAE